MIPHIRLLCRIVLDNTRNLVYWAESLFIIHKKPELGGIIPLNHKLCPCLLFVLVSNMDKSLQEYRTHLVNAEQKAQEDYDKTVITLSGGALGISFAFIKDIIGNNPITFKEILVMGWVCWGLSITLVLISYFLSHLALRKAINQFDTAVKNSNIGEIYSQRVGGSYSLITAILNIFGGLLFLAGVILITIFVWHNFGGKNAQ